MICRQCGANVSETSAACPGCGALLADDPWAPPGRDGTEHREGDAPFGYSAGGSPRRVSAFSKAAVALACLLPPVGLILGIVATLAARHYKNRPGNFAVALASIFTSLHVGIVWAAMVAVIVEETTRYDDPYYYGDPWAADPGSDPAPAPEWDSDPAGLQARPELQRLLEQLMQTPDGGIVVPPSDPGS